jgi:hypothetical protein
MPPCSAIYNSLFINKNFDLLSLNVSATGRFHVSGSPTERVCSYVCVCVCMYACLWVCVFVLLSVIRCSNNPLRLQ